MRRYLLIAGFWQEVLRIHGRPHPSLYSCKSVKYQAITAGPSKWMLLNCSPVQNSPANLLFMLCNESRHCNVYWIHSQCIKHLSKSTLYTPPHKWSCSWWNRRKLKGPLNAGKLWYQNRTKPLTCSMEFPRKQRAFQQKEKEKKARHLGGGLHVPKQRMGFT